MSFSKKLFTGEFIPTAPDPSQAGSTPTGKSNFNIAIYTGNGGNNTVTVGFQPDMIWLKSIDGADNHRLYDSNRGIGKPIYPNLTSAETAAANHLTTNSTSFSLNSGNNNSNGVKYIAWCWKVGGGASSNSNGNITAQVQVNSSIECSVITWAGNGSTSATVGHGLSGTPDFVFMHERSEAGGWNAGHVSMPSNHAIGIQSTAAGSSSMGNNGGLTYGNFNSTNFGFASGAQGVNSINKNGNNYVAYAFKSKSGISKYGGYSGTGSTGNSITGLGFEPNWIMLKKYNGTSNWVITDSQRDTTDVRTAALFSNSDSAQNTSADLGIEFDSDGFTLYGTHNDINASGGNYLYMALKLN